MAKYTDEQVKKALENCNKGYSCVTCPFYLKVACGQVHKLALDFINRQEAEIERLNSANLQLFMALENAKSEAIKEFVEKLKKCNCQEAEIEALRPFGTQVEVSKKIENEIKSEARKEFWSELKRRNTLDYGIVSTIAGDNLIKEMEGESDAQPH